MVIQKFFDERFGSLRVVKDNDGKEWFIAKDIASCLGYKDTKKAIEHVKENYKKEMDFTKSFGGGETPPPNKKGRGGLRSAIVINESGVYQLIMKSKLSQAEQFQDWVFEEVLPNLRKHGIQTDLSRDEIREYTKFLRRRFASTFMTLVNHCNKNENTTRDAKKELAKITKDIQCIACDIPTGERDSVTTEQLLKLSHAESEAMYGICQGVLNNSKFDDIVKWLKEMNERYQKDDFSFTKFYKEKNKVVNLMGIGSARKEQDNVCIDILTDSKQNIETFKFSM